MDFEEIKQIEDLKKKEVELTERLKVLFEKFDKVDVSTKMKEMMSQAVEEFKLFFKEKDFNIKENDNDVTAWYGEFKIILKLDAENFTLNLSIPNKQRYCTVSVIDNSPEVPLKPTNLTHGIPYERTLRKLKEEISRLEYNIEFMESYNPPRIEEREFIYEDYADKEVYRAFSDYLSKLKI